MLRFNQFMLVSFLVLGAAALILLAGCKGDTGPQGPAGPQGPTGIVPAQVQGWVDAYSTTLHPDSAEFDVQIKGPATIPSSVTINNLNVPYEHEDYAAWWFRKDIFPLPGGSDIAVVMNFLKPDGSPGVGRANLTMPGPFSIITPDPAVTYYLPQNSPLQTTWTASSKAEYYRVVYHLELHYQVTPGVWGDWAVNIDTVLTATTSSNMELLLSANQTFPTNWPHVSPFAPGTTSSGYIRIYPVSGPMRPSEPGNVTGDAVGAIWARPNPQYKGVTLKVLGT